VFLSDKMDTVNYIVNIFPKLIKQGVNNGTDFIGFSEVKGTTIKS